MTMTVVVCKSTRYGVGCGHPVNDHVTDTPNPACCCCNRQQNDPGHVTECVECHIRRAKAHLPLGATMGDVEPFIPSHLRQAFWRRAVTRWAESEGLRGRPHDR